MQTQFPQSPVSTQSTGYDPTAVLSRSAIFPGLTPLDDIMAGPFHIDVSRDRSYVVAPSHNLELALESLAPTEVERLNQAAQNQYVRGVLEGDESVDHYRATLFFLARLSARYAVSPERHAVSPGQSGLKKDSNHEERLPTPASGIHSSASHSSASVTSAHTPSASHSSTPTHSVQARLYSTV